MKPSDINPEAGEWMIYEYTIEVFLTFENENPIEISQAQISGLLIENDYDRLHIPICILDLMIPETLADRIKKESPAFNIKMDGYQRLPEETIDMGVITKINYFNDVFYSVSTNTDPQHSIELRKKIREASGFTDYEFTMDDLGNVFSFILMKENCFDSIKTLANAVLSDVTLTQAIGILSNMTKVKNVLMSNLDNFTVYDELLILPLAALSSIVYLEKSYGFHKEGTQIFMDFDTLYINRMSGKCTAWRDLEEKLVTICINDSGNAENICNGCARTTNEIFVNVDIEQYSSPTNSDVIDNITGMNVLLIDENTASHTEITSDTGNNYTVQTTKGHNPYVAQQLAIRRTESTKTKAVLCRNIDIGSLTPNKEYRFVTDNTNLTKELMGSYRISRVLTSFIKEGVHLSGVSYIELKGTT